MIYLYPFYYPNQIPIIDSAQSTAFNSGQIPLNDPTQPLAFNPGQIPLNDPAQPLAFNPGQIPLNDLAQPLAFNPGQIPLNDPAQPLAFNPGQIPLNDPAQPLAFNPGQIPLNDPTQPLAINSGQTSPINLCQIPVNCPGQIPCMPPSVVIVPDPRCDNLDARLSRVEQACSNKEWQSYVQEEAFSEVASKSHRLWVPGKHGQAHLLWDADLEKVVHVRVDPVFQKESYYILYLYGESPPLILSEKQFSKPSTLIGMLVRASGKTVHMYKNRHRTAELMRQYILSLVQEWHLSFYAGWSYEDDKWRYYLLNGSTHSSLRMDLSGELPHANANKKGSPSTELIAAEQFMSLMEAITDPTLRGVISTWMHASTLSTLLNGLGYRIAKGLCLYCTNAKSYHHLCIILAWYGDPAISLSMQPQRFAESMVERKDQPLLVDDAGNQKETANIVLAAVETGELPLRSSKDSPALSFNSLATVLSNTVSLISTSRHFATVEVPKDAFGALTMSELAKLCHYTPDYIQGFSKYIEDHIDDLIEYVSRGVDDVTADCDSRFEGLDANAMTAMGILMGVSKAVADYFHSLAAGKSLRDRFDALLSNDGINALTFALGNAADSEYAADDLVECFITFVNRMFSNNRFDLRSRFDAQIDTPCQFGTAGIIYEDERYLYFTREAMQSISCACCSSSPDLLNALQGAGLLQGATVNTGTYLTRTTIYSNNSQKAARVYKIERQDLEFY